MGTAQGQTLSGKNATGICHNNIREREVKPNHSTVTPGLWKFRRVKIVMFRIQRKSDY